MDSYLLADIIIKSFMILFGTFLVIKGKQAKSNLHAQETSLLSPNVTVVLGTILIVGNVFLLIELFL